MQTLNKGYLSAGKVGLHLDVSVLTIYRWYKWWENPNFEKPDDLFLPQYYYKDRRKTKYFKEEDLPALEKFRNALQTTHKGCMSEFNAALQWGKRGEKVLEKKGMTKKDVKRLFVVKDEEIL